MQSSFELPLWNDATGWKAFNAYSSIQLADINGDGQDELVGRGPDGIQIWQWEPHGQAWTQMNVGMPTLASTDSLMTADVDGDGQAEIIQVAPNLGSSPVVNVWHYDVGVGVWRLEPKLQLTLTPSVGLGPGPFWVPQPIAPTIKFAAMQNTGNKQQDLVSLAIQPAGTFALTYTPVVYRVNAGQTGWTQVTEGPTSVGAEYSTSASAIMQVGDVTGDGLADIVLLQQNGSLLVFYQTPGSGGVTFGTGQQVTVPNYGRPIYNFTLADTLGVGHDQIYIVDSAFIVGYQFTGLGLQFAGGSIPEDSSVSPVYGTLQTASIVAPNPTNPAQGTPILPSGQSVLMLDGNGLEQFSLQGVTNYAPPIPFRSNSPFVTVGRFGDDPSHYRTIQTGTVYAYSSAQTPVQYSETIVVARDANGIHTLVPTAASNNCGSTPATLPGFAFPKKGPNDRGYVWFPNSFSTRGQQLAYNCFGYITGYPNNIYAAFATSSNLQSIYNTVSGQQYASLPNSCGVPPAFSLTDFAAVQNTLEGQLNEAITVKSWFATYVGYSLQQINVKENAKLTQATQDLALPSDASSFDGLSAAGVAFQVVSSIFEFLNYAADTVDAPAYGVISEAVSTVGDIVSDVQQFETSPGGSLTGTGMALSTELANSYADQQTALADTEDKVSGNWDLVDQLYQQIQSPSFARFTQAQLDATNTAAAKTYGISAWQQLMPSAWKIYGLPDFSTSGVDYQMILGSYPTKYVVQAPISWSLGCSQLPGVSAFVYMSVPSSGNYPPAPVSAIQDLTDPNTGLGVNWYDVLGRRNGWQNVPVADANLFNDCYPGNIWTIPAVNPYYTPPPLPAPSYGAPSQLIISGGEASGKLQPSCNGSTPDILQQSTPINSVFPVPVDISVQDASNAGVPNATVQIIGQGLSPNVSRVVTDVNGNATAYLLANNIIERPYTATFSIIRPPLDQNQPACGTQQYILQNTPAASGTPTGTPDIQTLVQVTNKTTVSGSVRRWSIQVLDSTGTADGGSLTGSLTLARGSSSCKPTPVATSTSLTQTGGQAFTGQLEWDFGSCKGLNVFTLNVSGTLTIPLDDGTSYQASYSASTNNQLP